MAAYLPQQWREILAYNQLDTREKIWMLKADWFEEPNQRRGGWSGVSRVELKLPNGETMGVFLKRQEDHVSRSIRHPIKGFSTFLREFNNIRAFEEKHIPSLELMFFEDWQDDGGHQRAVLMTKELDGYLPISSDEYQPGQKYVAGKQQKLILFKKLAQLMQVMHENHYQHNCFYPKHIFAKQLAEGNVDLRVIDLEKVKKSWDKKRAEFRDLYTLHRHAHQWGIKDKLRFFKIYRNEEKLSNNSKELWHKITDKIDSKAKAKWY